MRRNDLSFTIKLAGPLLTQSSEPGAFGLDIIVARNSEGVPYIPGTLISGKLDQAWQEINDAAGSSIPNSPDLQTLLGRESQNGQPYRKQLFFSDITLVGTLDSERIHNRVTIDDLRGAAGRQQLVFMESPFLEGKEYDFKGSITYFSTEQDSARIEKFIKTGLRWLTQVGAMRTVGYGRVQKVSFASLQSATIPTPAGNFAVTGKIGLKITPEHPFCFAGKPVADNLFESTDFIPGAAVIGSIMTTWNFLTNGQPDPDRKILRKEFNQIRITHAFPSKIGNKRPVVYPKSLVKIRAGKKKFESYDVATCEKPRLIKGKAPVFSIDWKDSSDLDQEFGWVPVQKELRIRTGIHPRTLRSAEKELFSYEQVIPKNYSWYAELDLEGITPGSEEKVFAQLRSLLTHGLIGLGKTKTPAKVEFILPPQTLQPVKASNAQPLTSNQWIITLQSDTLLGSPEGLNETSGVADLKAMYEKAWQDLSGGSLKLVRYFASQRINGGIWRRKTMQQGQQYCPWLLTEAGSVFVLEIAASSLQDGQDCITKWLEHGVPVKEDVCTYYNIPPDADQQWQVCPFIPQNGYGEIAVNLSVHTDKMPPESAKSVIINEEDISHGA